jgi:hypothetical protein
MSDQTITWVLKSVVIAGSGFICLMAAGYNGLYCVLLGMFLGAQILGRKIGKHL